MKTKATTTATAPAATGAAPAPATVTHSDASAILSALGIDCPPGASLEIDVVVSLRGVISKGSDGDSAATVRALSLLTVARILARAGIVREAAARLALAALRDEQAPTADELAAVESFRALVAETLPRVAVNGRRGGKLAVERV